MGFPAKLYSTTMGESEIQKAEKLYSDRLRPLLEPALKGKYVAIDVASGDYFVGDEIMDAYQKASLQHPDRTFVFKHIGYSATRFIGSR